MPEPGNDGRFAEALIPPLTNLVQSEVTCRFGGDPDATRADRVMRAPNCAILVQRRGRLHVRSEDGDKTPLPLVALLGPTLRGHLWEPEPHTEFVLLNLAPGATHQLFGHAPSELLEHCEDLRHHPLHDWLAEAHGAVRSKLWERLQRWCPRNRATDHARQRQAASVAGILAQRNCGPRVRDYAQCSGLSVRSLQRLTRDTIGLTPKQILAVERIRSLVALTENGWRLDRAALAQEGGFFDQSHMRQELLKHDFGPVDDLIEGGHIVTRR